MNNNAITLKEAYDILSRSPFFGRDSTKGQRKSAAKEYQEQFTQAPSTKREKEQIQ